MNKVKYYMINDDTVIAVVYEDDKYGRTMVVTYPKLDTSSSLRLIDASTSQEINDINLLDFLQEMLPVNNQVRIE